MNAKIAALARSWFVCALVVALASIPMPAEAATFTVNSTNDADDGSCDARHCSLREALIAANASPGPDTIAFNIPGPGPHVIRPNGTLWLSDDGTTIDGTTQPGYSPDPGRFGTPAVFLQAPTSMGAGRGGGPGFGLEINSSGNTVRGLRLSGCGSVWGRAIEVNGSGNLVERNIIGLEPDGEVCTPTGVRLGGDSNVVRDNVIVAYGEAIIASGSYYPPGSGHHVIQGNYIGLAPSGSAAAGDLNEGIRVLAIGVLIGGDGPEEGNVISGADVGILVHGEETEVVGNLIGTNPSGTAAVPNREAGIAIWGEGNVVRSNLISGNPVGIQVGHSTPYDVLHGRDVVIQGNFIGTDRSGSAAIPNGKGIVLGPEAETAQIGGADPSQANVISGNGFGIEVQGGSPVILGNHIGTDADGTAAIPNEYGVVVWDRATDVRVGGAAAGEGNLISGNSRTGLWLRSNAGVVQGNWIGLTADGRAALPNDTGFDVDGDSNQIGGANPGEGNVIAGNEDGVVIDGESNMVLGNTIGADPSGSFAIPNGVGVYLSGDGNTLGAVATPNVISGNGRGLVVSGSGNAIQGNLVGTDAAGAAVLPNNTGIELFGPYNQIGAGTLPGNQVLYNEGPGILLSSLAIGNAIAGNTIAFNGQGGIRVEPGSGVALNTFSRNSIYRNDRLGIAILAGAQHDIVPPVIDRITVAGESTAGSIQGHACPGCQVEVFLADPDPSGSGEGRTFYGAGPAAEGGAFTFPVPPGSTVGMCQPFTATSTDAEGNTSEFSLNRTPFGCLRMPWWLLVLGVAGLLGVGAIGGALAGGSRGRPWLGGAAGAGAGGLVGVAIALVLVRLPFVQIVSRQVPEEGGPPTARVPPCAQFLNAGQLRPEDGAAFNLGTDVLFELSPQPDPPGVQTRWTLHLSGPSGLEVSELLSTPSTSLASLGVDEPAAGAYRWRLSAERLDGETEVWNPFCADLADRAFLMLQPTPVPILETPVPEPTATTTVTPAPPQATFLQNANCRKGPGLDYDVVTSLLQGQQVDIEGRNAESTWWWIRLPQSQAHCWVAGGMVETSGELSGLPLIAAPPKPTVTPTPVQGCWVWVPNLQKNVCTAPCPPNPQPGGVCTP